VGEKRGRAALPSKKIHRGGDKMVKECFSCMYHMQGDISRYAPHGVYMICRKVNAASFEAADEEGEE